MGMNKAHWLCSVATASLLLFQTSGASFAQEVEGSDTQDQVAEGTGPETLETIVVPGNYNGDRFAEAADRNTAIYISETAVRAAETGDLKDLFAEEASVTVGGGIPIAQKIYVNGVDMLNLNVTIDGAMQNNRSFHHVTANAIDPGLLKAVRVDAGVAAADSGPNAIAGSVAFQTKDALDLLEDGQKMGGTAQVSYDTNSATFSEALTLYGRHQNVDLLGYAKNDKGDDYTTGNDWKIPGTKADLQSFLVKGGYSSDQGDRFEIAAQVLNDNALRPYRANFGAFKGAKPRIYKTRRSSYSFSYKQEQPTEMWDPEVNFGFSENKIDTPVPYNAKGSSSTLNGKVANTFHFLDLHSVTSGVDFYNKNSDITSKDGTSSESSKNLGVFTQVRLQPLDNFKLSFGGRFDHQEFSGVNGFDKTVNGASGNISAAFDILENLTLKAGYSNVFGGIALEDNYTFSNSWNYAGLKPARSQNATAGFEFNKWNFKLTGEVFKTSVKNARAATGNSDFKTQGYNVGLGYNWQNGFAKLTYSNSEIEVNGKNASVYTALDFGTPLGHVIAFNVAHTFEPYNLTVGGSIDAALEHDTKGSVSTNKIPGYTTFNMFAEYEPEQIKGLIIRLAANNILDKNYADKGTYGNDYDTISALAEPGRSFLATVKYKF